MLSNSVLHWVKLKTKLKPIWEMYNPMLFPLDIYKHSVVVDMMEDPPGWFFTLDPNPNYIGKSVEIMCPNCSTIFNIEIPRKGKL